MPYKDPQKQKEAKRRYYQNIKQKIKHNISDPPKFPQIKIPENINEKITLLEFLESSLCGMDDKISWENVSYNWSAPGSTLNYHI